MAPGRDPDTASTALLTDGKPVGIAMEGLQLVDQFDTGQGYLLVADHDDPWEELTVVTLLSKGLKPLASKLLGKFVHVFPSRTFAVQCIDIDGDALILHGSGAGEGRYRVAVADVWTWRGRGPGVKAVWTPT